MTAHDGGELVIASVAVLGLTWTAVKWVFAPHLRNTIADTVRFTVGPQLREVPKLTLAVTELTGAIREQNTDVVELKDGLNDLQGEVRGLRDDFAQLGERTAALEGMHRTKALRRGHGAGGS